MKKILLAVLLGSGVITASLVSVANMNVVNLLVSGTDYGSGGNEQFITDNGDGQVEHKEFTSSSEGVSSGTMQTLQSGLVSDGGASLNLLWLLQNAAQANKSSYAYQLLEVYSKLEQGVYNDLPYHISPEAIAGSHKNETSLTSFVVPTVTGYGKATSGILGKTINGKVITLENAVKEDILGHAPKSGSVWADKDKNGGDGCPDGPFQIIQCLPFKESTHQYASKLRTDKRYDLYNFVDAANIKDVRYNSIAKVYAESGSTPDPRAISMLSALAHNRGDAGVGWNLFGYPYDLGTSKQIKSSKILKTSLLGNMTSNQLYAAVQFPKDLIKWFEASNIPLEKMQGGNSVGQGVGLLLVLANGGFIDIPLQKTSANNVSKLSNDIIQKIFPGQTNKTIVDYVNNNFIKQPWDVLGMSKAEYGKIYGNTNYNNYEEGYSTPEGNFRNTAFYIDKNLKSDIYVAGENVVVRAVEGIALGYLLDVGISGTYTILNIALEAGIKSMTDGTVVDPSNPQAFYKIIQSAENETYNPAGAADGNFGKFLDGLGLTGTLSEPQQAQIEAMYLVSGGGYDQGKRGRVDKGTALFLDCSSMATIGLFMDPTTKAFVNTGDIMNGVWLKSTKKTKAVKGIAYDAKVVQLDGSGKPMAPATTINTKHQKTDKEWLNLLQTGDIVNGRKNDNGHVWTYLGKNKTKKTMVLTQDVSKVGAKFSKYEPGAHFTMQAAFYADSSGMGLMPLWEDQRYLKIYHAMRPVYNLK